MKALIWGVALLAAAPVMAGEPAIVDWSSVPTT